MSKDATERPWYHPVRLFWTFVGQWFIIGTALGIIIGWRWPDVAKSGGILRTEYSVQYGAIALIFLITGLTLSTRSLFAQLRNVRLHLYTQVISLLIFPAVMFGITNIIKAAPHGQIDEYVLIGLMYMACACTSVASNISMTIAGGGSGEAATVEVVIGNTLGVFLSPLLNLMFFSTPGWHLGLPVTPDGRAGTSGLPEIYRRQMMKMGLALFIPMFVGQIVQNLFPKPVKWAAPKFHLSKISSVMLLFLMWSIFSTAFANDAFSNISGASITLIIFLNIASYLGWTCLCILFIRLPFLPTYPDQTPGAKGEGRGRMARFANTVRLPKGEVTAICYCASAKGLAVAALVLDVLYGGLPDRERALISIPIVLYQAEQVVIAQLLTGLFRRWNRQPDPYFPKSETSSSSTNGGSRTACGAEHDTQLSDLEMRNSVESDGEPRDGNWERENGEDQYKARDVEHVEVGAEADTRDSEGKTGGALVVGKNA